MKYPETAKRLTRALSNKNMKPQELAEKSGVSKASISQYVNGSHAPSNISSGKMAEVLGVSPLWLMGFDVPENYYTNIDTATLAQEVFDNPDLRVLFDTARDASPEDIKTAVTVLKALKGKDND